MTKNELNEIFEKLKQSGIDLQLCDAQVPYFADGVPAGYPEAPGDYDGEMVPMPRSFLKLCDFVLAVHGDSMKDAGILNGDDVIVKHDVRFDDGDVVVAWLDGDTTLKSYYRDDDGEVWLVPANDDFQPMRVSDYSTAYILGRVTGVKKGSPRVSYNVMRRRMREVKEKLRRVLTDDVVRSGVMQVLSDIKTQRMWFCVYRVLADAGYLHKGRYEELAQQMDVLFPDNDFGINPKDIGRMDVQSFHRPYTEWYERDAPVQGKRFREYRQLAADLTAQLNG